MDSVRSALSGRAQLRSAIVSPPVNDAVYERIFPYYAEVCALSELRKRAGFGVPVYSGMGGHSLLYLHGVRVDRTARYPVLAVHEQNTPGKIPGVGISVNSHYKNVNWVATESQDFLLQGAISPGERLTESAYLHTQHRAKDLGILDGIVFHDHLLRDKPHGMSERDYKYEISIATDYAVAFGRDTYRARIPLDRSRMAAVIAYLNALNAPYRDGSAIYRWQIFNNNCCHVAHNALAMARVWDSWPTGQHSVLAAFKFPVPKNEFVDIMLRTNDLPIDDADAIYRDEAARSALLEAGTLPTAPGALAIAVPAITANDIYDTAHLRLIFYDNPFWGAYRRHFSRIFREPRYLDLQANIHHFATVYRRALASRNVGQPHKWPAKKANHRAHLRAKFDAHYRQYIDSEAERIRRIQASLEDVLAPVVMAGQ